MAGILTNNGSVSSLLIKSNSTASGSLISDTDDVPLTYERYLSGNEWHITSTPVTGIDIQSFLNAAENQIPIKVSDYGMTTYDEASNNWNPFFTAATTGTLDSAVAYLLRRTDDASTLFQGNSRGSSTTIDITRNGAGWNGIGNPYPSAIKIRGIVPGTDSFLGENADQLDPSYAALYIFDPANPLLYQILNNSQTGGRFLDQDYIQAGQGFLVRSQTGGGTISFTPEMKGSRPAEAFYKKRSELHGEWRTLTLRVNSSEKEASTLLLFNERMTPGLDVTYDAGLLGGDPALKVFTRLPDDNGINFALQCLPDKALETLTIPLGIESISGGAVSVTIEEDDLPAEITVLLEDSESRQITNLRESRTGYQATLPSNATYSDRFKLRIIYFTESNANYTSLEEAGVPYIYAYNKTVVLGNFPEKNARLHVSDLSGRTLQIDRIEAGAQNTFDLSHLSSGVYVFHVAGNSGLLHKRLFIGD